ncbi:MAG TPA: TonB-dependent receptor [Magnetospirillaceae bacterium]|nr:TonB-dependent receptor [Magnetospirillaceae bacterium]
MARSKLRFRAALLAGAALLPPPAPAAALDGGDQPVGEVVIEDKRIGGGLIAPETRAQGTSSVGADYVAQQVPTEHAFQLVKLLPGANVATSDPFGLSNAYSLALRGLGQDEIGVLLDGAPQNDIGYFFAYPSQFIDAENLKQVSLAQGAVDLDSPILNGVAGLLSVSSRDPEAEFGGLADLTYGSYNLKRGFLRVDTGKIPDTGLSAFLSYSYTGVDNWRGPGRDKKQHVDFKAVEEWGDGNRIAIAASYNDALTSGYPQPTLSDWQHYGRGFNYDATYLNAANPGGDPSYWKLYLNSFRNLYFSLPSTFTLAENVTLDVTPYVQSGYGNSPYGTTLATTGNSVGAAPDPVNLVLPNAQDGVANVMGDYTGDQFRSGAVFKLSWRLANHTLIAGYWFDYADDVDQEPFTPLNAGGDVSTLWAWPSSLVRTEDGQIYYALNEHTVSQTQAGFIADSARFLDDRLQIDLGFKGVYSSRDGTNNLPGPQYDVSYYTFQPLPRAAMRYQIDPANQLFADVTTSFRVPNEYDFYDTYYGGAVASAASRSLKPERSVAEEFGYRYQQSGVVAAVTAFNYDFSDRQIATIIDQGGALINATINAGGQTSRGVDAELGLPAMYGVTPYVSAEYLDATVTSNIQVGADVLPSRDKTAVRSPRFQGAAGLSYRDEHLSGSFTVKYLGSQYATFMNDEKIPGYAQLDASIGYDFGDLGAARHPSIRVNLLNLTDRKVLSGVASATTNANDVTGLRGSVIAGSSPTYYIGAGFAASVTISTGF